MRTKVYECNKRVIICTKCLDYGHNKNIRHGSTKCYKYGLNEDIPQIPHNATIVH